MEDHKIPPKNNDIIESVKFLTIAFSFGVFMYLFKIPCPIRFFTGISCVGCGMTRAWVCILQGKFRESFYYHPLALLAIFVLIWWGIKSRLSTKIYKMGNGIFIALFIVVYIIRLCQSGDIIGCDISSGAFFRIGEYIIQKFL